MTVPWGAFSAAFWVAGSVLLAQGLTELIHQAWHGKAAWSPKGLNYSRVIPLIVFAVVTYGLALYYHSIGV